MSGTRRLQGTKLQVNTDVTGTGFIGKEEGFPLFGESSLRFRAFEAQGTTLFDIEAKIEGQEQWDIIGSVLGTEDTLIDIRKYSQIRFRCIRFTPASGQGKIRVTVNGLYNNVANEIDSPTEISLASLEKLQHQTNTLLCELLLELKKHRDLLELLF